VAAAGLTALGTARRIGGHHSGQGDCAEGTAYGNPRHTQWEAGRRDRTWHRTDRHCRGPHLLAEQV